MKHNLFAGRSWAMMLTAVLLLGTLAGCRNAESAPDPVPEPAPAQEASEPAPAPTEEFTLPREDGCNQLTLYWSSATADYDACDVWMWWDGKDGCGYAFHPCAYGAKCVVNVPEEIEQVGFIVRTDCSDPCGTSWGTATKDFEDDRFAVITGEDTVVYLKTGDGGQYESTDGGATLTQIRLFSLAGIVSPHEIRYFISPAAQLGSTDDVSVVADDGTRLAVEGLSSLGNSVTTGVITLADELDIARSYTVSIAGYGEKAAVPTDIFDSPEFTEAYTYDGDDLGAVIDGDKTVFKVWAPTANAVRLNLFEAGNDCAAYETLDMIRGEKGVWQATAPCGHGTYYTYTVSTAALEQEAVDPYARAVGVNGERGMVVDLARTDPEGFAQETYFDGVGSYSEAVVWEVHVRDFSNALTSSQYPGKYLAFTETGLTNSAGVPVGVDYLKQLGITHVHLQPVYDYATVDETKLDTPQFNWGYDPKNYNAPDGSYSTDPYHGEVRIGEFKQMVHALHEAGIGVVMDVVYNHTYDLNSNLNKIVPYYYYRFNASGKASNGSGCGNETASERAMFRKFMVDSVRYWAEEYKVDGFRFDLMALHDVETMQQIENAVHAVNPHALLYGEGWTGGSTPLSASEQANQGNIRRIKASEGAIGSIAVFDDVIRDGLKGSVFAAAAQGYINGSATDESAQRVIFGLRGGAKSEGIDWYVEHAMVVNYMSAHDNNTLWDKLALSCPNASTEEKLAMNRLGAAAVMLSKGMPFLLAGEEMLRTKGGDENSYASSDAVNNIDWEALVPGSDAYEMMTYYRALIELRRNNSFLTHGELNCRVLDGAAIEITWRERGSVTAVGVLNPGDSAMDVTLPDGEWNVLIGTVSSAGAEAPAHGVLLVSK